jgi:hypothetical protein
MTARAWTNDELTLLRSSTQFTKLSLAVHKPNVIYTALLNGVPSSNDQVYQVTFDNGSGTLGDVTAGMTLYVGTSAGAYDLGMCRIRKAPSAGTYYIGLTSEIVWQDNAFLTVVDDFDLWPKHATIADSVLSMDVDVAYSNQHTNFNPVPIMGPHAVVWLDEATVDVEYDASDSWVPGSTISGYAWSAPGASASSGMISATPTITYNAAGIYRVYLTVTAANGKTTTGVRHVFVYDRDENKPSTVFQLAQCVGDYETGGWMFDMEMQAEAALSDIRDRSLVILFAEDWYGTTKQSIGPVEGRENIVCVGRVVGESIRWDRETGRVHFTVQGAHHWLGRVKAFPVEMYFATNTPDSWSVMPSMTVDRILWHILYWHSTAVETMDFYRTGDTRLTDEGKTLASTLWGQLQDIALSKILASPGVDRFGRLFVQVEPQMVPEASRDWATVMDLTPGDWSEGIDFQRVTVNDVSLITLTSQLCDTSGAVSVLYSLSPGHVPRRYGDPEQADRLLASTQAQSNGLAGLLLGWRTNEFPEIPVSLAMNNRMIDVFPRQFCALEVTADKTPRGIAFDGNMIPRRVSFYFEGDTGWMHPELVFEAETFEQPNTNGDVLDVEDMSIPPFPPFNFPDLPPLDPIFPGDVSSTPSGPPVVLMLDAEKGILRTENFSSDDPTWQFWNTGIASADIPFLRNAGLVANSNMLCLFFMTPNGACYLGVRDKTFRRWFDIIYRAPAIGATWEKIIDVDWIEENEGANGGIIGMGYNPNKAEEVAFIAVGSVATSTSPRHFWIGNSAGWTQGASVSLATNFFGGITFGVNKWVWDAITASQERFIRFSADGSTQEDTSDGMGQGGVRWHVRAGTSPFIIKKATLDNSILVYSDDNGENFAQIDVDPSTIGGNLAISPDGYMMGSLDPGTASKGRSSDFGTTWGALGALSPGGNYAWKWCGGAGASSQWIAARANIWFSPDWGNTWQDKDGNMPYLIPLSPTILKIIVPGYH